MDNAFFSKFFGFIDNYTRREYGALHFACAAFLLFFFVKVFLTIWYKLDQDTYILSDLPFESVLILPALDLVVAICLSSFIFMLQVAGSVFSRSKIWPFAVPFYSLYIFLVVVCIVNFKLQIVYGRPFAVDLLRKADDLRMMKDSIVAYLGYEELVIIFLAISVFFVSRSMAGWLGRARVISSPQRFFIFLIVVAFLSLCYAYASYRTFGQVYTFGWKKNYLVHYARNYKPEPGVFNMQDYRDKLLLKSDVPFAKELWRHPGFNHTPSVGVQGSEYYGVAKDYNLVLVLLESVGGGQLNADSAPFLHALRENSLNFPRHYTTASTSIESVYSLFYSDYKGQLDLRKMYGEQLIRPSIEESFKEAGYSTAVFQSGYLSYTDFSFIWEEKGVDTLVGAAELYKSTGKVGWSWGAFEETTVGEIKHWLEENASRPFFLTYRPVFPHQPYFAPIKDVPFSGESWSEKHQNSIYYVDKNIADLVGKVKSLGVYENTVIAVVADHGETTSIYPVGHGIKISDDELNVPFYISSEALFSGGTYDDLPSNHLDVAPTLIDIFGLKKADEWKGRSLLGAVKNRLLFFSKNHANQQAYLDGDVMYIFNRTTGQNSAVSVPNYHLLDTTVSEEQDKVAREFEKWAIWHHLIQ